MQQTHPVWLDGCDVESIDASNQVARVRAQAGEVILGDVPEGWEIVVDMGSMAGRVTAASVGQRVALSFPGHSRRPITLDGPFRQVSIKPLYPQATLPIELTTSETKLILASGTYEVDGEGHSFRLEADGGAGQVRVSGSALVREIRGSGPLTVGNECREGLAVPSYNGELEVEALRGAEFTQPEMDLRVSGETSRCSLGLRTLEVGGDTVASKVAASGKVQTAAIVDTELEVGGGLIALGAITRCRITADPDAEQAMHWSMDVSEASRPQGTGTRGGPLLRRSRTRL